MSRKHHHENLTKEFLSIFIPSFCFAIVLISLLLCFSACHTTRVGCTPKQERKAQRLLDKSYLTCPVPFTDLAAKLFNNTVYVHDTSWQTQTIGVHDTLTKGDTSYIYVTDTLTRYKVTTKREINTAALDSANISNNELRAKLAISESQSEKNKNDYKVVRNKYLRLIGINIGIVVLIVLFFVGKSYFKPLSILK